MLVGVHGALCADECASFGEPCVDGGDEVATVVVADHPSDGLWVKSQAVVVEGVDHPLDCAVLELVELLAGHSRSGTHRVPVR